MGQRRAERGWSEGRESEERNGRSTKLVLAGHRDGSCMGGSSRGGQSPQGRCRWAGAHGARNPQESSSDGFRFSLKEGARPAAECEKREEDCSGTQCAGDRLRLAVRY